MQRELLAICACILGYAATSRTVPHYNVGDYYAQRGLQKLGSMTFGNDLGFDSRNDVEYGGRSKTPTRFGLNYPNGETFMDSNRGNRFPFGDTIMRGYGSIASRRGFSIVRSVLSRSPFRFEH